MRIACPKVESTYIANAADYSRGRDSARNFLRWFVTRGHLRGKQITASRLLKQSGMKFFCRHCDEVVAGQPYRVISEENGVVLLDMTVCHSCYEQARALGLYSEVLSSEPASLKYRRPSGDVRMAAHR